MAFLFVSRSRLLSGCCSPQASSVCDTFLQAFTVKGTETTYNRVTCIACPRCRFKCQDGHRHDKVWCDGVPGCPILNPNPTMPICDGGHVSDMFRICFGHFSDMFRACVRACFVQEMPKHVKKLFQNVKNVNKMQSKGHLIEASIDLSRNMVCNAF